MAQFTLQPCKLSLDQFVILPDSPITIEWPEFKSLLAPSGSIKALRTLRASRLGDFIGLIRHPRTGEPTTFLFQTGGNPKNLSIHFKKDASIPGRIISVYRLEAADWGCSCQEL